MGFDLLRGLCAFAVMSSHLLLWEAHADLNHVGLYSVTVFFTLSGASIYIAYADKIKNGMAFSTFLGRRFFRLAPLYWLIVLLHGGLWHKIGNVFMNLAFLFGFANPGTSSILMGGWSLGIEFIFYFTFPVFLICTGNRFRMISCFLLSLVIQASFVASIARMEGGITGNWDKFAQFTSFVAYFLGGCVIGKILISTSAKVPQIVVWMVFQLLLITAGTFASLSDDMSLAGASGALMTIVCLLLVLVAGHLHIPSCLGRIAGFFGAVSYGVYLLHPFILRHLGGMRPYLWHGHFILVIMLTTICAAFLLERYFERPIKRYGYQLLRK
jgi:peptidoglycan/LPS O-acetylase OafA/YrhL